VPLTYCLLLVLTSDQGVAVLVDTPARLVREQFEQLLFGLSIVVLRFQLLTRDGVMSFIYELCNDAVLNSWMKPILYPFITLNSILQLLD
jgi:hypothetical protein